MDWFKSFVLVIVLSLCCVVLTQGTANNGKPGSCPMFNTTHSKNNILCRELCLNDTECLGDEKCCDTGCGHICHEPTSSMSNNSKPGHCPPSSGDGGLCVNQCETDGECQHTKKCCNNGCANECIEPEYLSPKPGSCPTFQGGQCTLDNCTDDYYCPGQQKCCHNGCTNICADPVTATTTETPPYIVECPLPQSQNDSLVGACVDKCASDGDCPHGLSCCSNGCGHICLDLYAPVDHDCDIGWFASYGSCYMLVPTKVEYSLASRECAMYRHNSHLADFHNKDKYMLAIYRLVHQSAFESHINTWIGLHQTQHGQWVWTNGQELNYDLWLDGEPSNNSACAASRGIYEAAGYLSDQCRSTNPFLCEYELGEPPTHIPTEKAKHPLAPMDAAADDLHKLGEAIIAVIAIAIVLTLVSLGGLTIYCIKRKPRTVARRRRRTEEARQILDPDMDL